MTTQTTYSETIQTPSPVNKHFFDLKKNLFSSLIPAFEMEKLTYKQFYSIQRCEYLVKVPNFSKADNFRFKPEVRWCISKLKALSDWPSLISPVYALKFSPLHLKSQKTDKFRFKPEVRNFIGSGELTGLDYPSLTVQVLLLAFYELKTDHFRFDRNCVGGAQIW